MSRESAATILVVDDNPAGRYATSRVLRAAGFKVLEAATGNDGVKLAPRTDLIVLDVNLPDISGFEVCRQIRAFNGTARMPVIHLSATFVKDTDKVLGLEAGADGYLTHPVEPPVLVATVNAFLRARRAEDEMRQSEAKFKAIFDQAPSGILLVSNDLVYLEANPAMCAILRRPREDIIGRHNSSFVPAGYEQDATAITRTIEERGSWRGAFPLIRDNGTHVELEWSIGRFSGVPDVLLVIVNDITERKAHELERERLLAAEKLARTEAESANRLKDEFLATLSHELRTPLNAIVGWSQLLKRGDSTPEDIAEGLDAIDRSAKSQAQLIDDLLDVSRIISGKVRLDIRQIDAAETIRAALETTSHAAQAKQLFLQQDLDPSAGMIHADPDRLQQIVWNLVNNAVKFTPSRGTIRVTLARDQSQAVITVSDNGQGIALEFLPHIFERFRQQDATTKRNQGGLGLGLAIVKHLVEMHGGTIAAQSEGANKGAAFTVRLPIAPIVVETRWAQAPSSSNANAAHQIEAAGESTDVSLHGVRILLVDDDIEGRAMLKHLLVRSGAQVSEAADVPSALELVKLDKPQVLISDIGIPQQDGYDLIRAIRAQGLSPAQLPAIALTAFARTEDRTTSVRAGFQLHFSKPVDASELLTAIASLFEPQTKPS
jgi:PAS domain S-box-containing protein